MTLPKTAWPKSAGSTPDRCTASRTTVAARSHGGTPARPPPYRPMAVRVPDSTTTSFSSVMTFSPHVSRPSSTARADGFFRSPALSWCLASHAVLGDRALARDECPSITGPRLLRTHRGDLHQQL